MIIDADAHFTPQLTANTGNGLADDWIKNYQTRKQGYFSDPIQREQELKLLKVDRQLLNPMGKSLELFYDIDPKISPYIMRAWNDAMLEIVESSDFFDMNIWLCLQNIDASLSEIDRMLDKKFFGIHVSESPCWGFIQELEPVFKKISQHQIPWYVHLTVNNDNLPYRQNVPEQFINLQQTWIKTPWMFSLASLILGGTLDRYPNLKIVVAERDIDWVDKFCQGFEQEGLPTPMPYLQKNFWFTIEPENPNFLHSVDQLGIDRLLFATDWPHDKDLGGANSLHDVDTVNSLNLNIEDQNQLYHKNYLSLYR
jgi:predicted TIM-barrel fold metal-dependent hydrolase